MKTETKIIHINKNQTELPDFPSPLPVYLAHQVGYICRWVSLPSTRCGLISGEEIIDRQLGVNLKSVVTTVTQSVND